MFPTGVGITGILEGANASMENRVAAATVDASVADRRDKFFMFLFQNSGGDVTFLSCLLLASDKK
jgi:hypothetical protein